MDGRAEMRGCRAGGGGGRAGRAAGEREREGDRCAGCGLEGGRFLQHNTLCYFLLTSRVLYACACARGSLTFFLFCITLKRSYARVWKVRAIRSEHDRRQKTRRDDDDTLVAARVRRAGSAPTSAFFFWCSKTLAVAQQLSSFSTSTSHYRRQPQQ